MKDKLFNFTLALIALCSVLTLQAATSPVAPRRFARELPIGAVTVQVPANGDTVTVGTSRVMVSLRLGSPNAVLRDGSWLYYGYTAHSDRGNREQAGTLVVRFISSQVVSLTLADDAIVVTLLQERWPPDRSQLLAAGDWR